MIEKPLLYCIDTIEKVLTIRDYIHMKEGRKLSFSETLEYLAQDYVDSNNILDKLHERKRKNV